MPATHPPAAEPAPTFAEQLARSLDVPAGRRPALFRVNNVWTVDDVAAVQAHPFRRLQEAREMAERIAAAPGPYLSVLIGLAVPGIVDLRWDAEHARPAAGIGGGHA